MSSQSVAFDLYGTLLDTSSVSKSLSAHLPQHIDADDVSREWRKYQLEYTWRLTSMGVYENFEAVTRRSLVHAVTEVGGHLSDDAIEDVIRSYDRLNVFEDVPEALEKLKQINVPTVVFSNGTKKMVDNSIQNSPDLKHFSNTTLPFVVVDEVKAYKPSPAVYHHLARKVGKENRLHELWLVSGNPFDVVGARQAGINVIWVDRKGKGWCDQLGEPTRVVRSLHEVAGIVSLN
ncbi:haloacid dehalogenase, type II [Ramaria rubella]|nr:haloacid dehalogenase, type II [Ramaria rubella]